MYCIIEDRKNGVLLKLRVLSVMLQSLQKRTLKIVPGIKSLQTKVLRRKREPVDSVKVVMDKDKLK